MSAWRRKQRRHENAAQHERSGKANASRVGLLGASRAARIDTLVGIKDPQLLQVEHTIGRSGSAPSQEIYPLVAERLAGGRNYLTMTLQALVFRAAEHIVRMAKNGSLMV